MRFIIAGNIGFLRKRKIIKMLNSWDLKEGERFDVPLDTLHSGAPVLIRRKDATNLTFGFSFLTPRRLETSEAYSIGALNHILTGTMNSKIFGEARKRGLIYSFESGLTYDELNTSWDFSGEVDLENAEKLFNLIHESLEKVLNGELDGNDIKAAKSYMLGRAQISAQTVGNLADFYADEYFKADEIENYDLIPVYIEKINKQQIIELAREFAGSEISSLVAVGSCEKSFITPLADRLKL